MTAGIAEGRSLNDNTPNDRAIYCSEKNEEDYYDYVVATFNDAKETGDTAPAVL